ncbi:MAG: hypothetical protein FD134_1221 [Gallionellaceae bacterium]|nr:MAG: hypothetical protein FD134_1221 [Gallionellaceae bacterium]
MYLKNRKYMEGEEFKARQGVFEIVCLKSYALIKKFVEDCRSGWYELFHPKQPRAANRSLPLPFDRPLTHREWAKKAMQICINVETA